MIYRSKHNKENPYYVKNRTAVSDNRLSWKAKGLHDYLMSKPDDWAANEQELATASKDGISSVRSGVKELIALGYMAKVQVRDEKGVIRGWETHTYETPEQNPHYDAVCHQIMETHNVDYPHVENPDGGKSHSNKYRYIESNDSNDYSSSVQSSSEELVTVPSARRKTKPKSKKKKERHPLHDEAARRYAQALPAGVPGHMWPTEHKWIARLVEEGNLPHEIESFVKAKASEPFWNGKHMSAKYVYGNIGAWKKGGMKSGKGSYYDRDTSRNDHPVWAEMARKSAASGKTYTITQEEIDAMEF